MLASASPARLRVLRLAGFDPEVIVSGVDESGIDGLAPEAAVATLAERKATAVAAHLSEPALVVGCDSMFELGGELHGKPATPADAVARWKRMRGSHGVLHTGHCIVDTESGRQAVGVESTTVHFEDVTDDEIDAYVATGEPLHVAGAFTLDNRAAPFVRAVEGDPSTVIGISLPTVRRLLADLDVRITDLWVTP